MAAIVATAAFVLAILIGVYLLHDHPEREWYEGRAAAESTKTLAWRYAAGGTDFPHDGDPRTTDKEFLSRLTEVIRGLKTVRLHGSEEAEEISPAMRALRGAPFDTRRETYRKDRVKDQREWYSNAAQHNETLALTWRLGSLSAQFVGVLGGLLKATGSINFDVLGIAAAAAAAAVAWLQTREHGTLANAYGITARELGIIDSDLSQADEEEWPVAVDNAERAISREHTLWRARRTAAAEDAV